MTDEKPAPTPRSKRIYVMWGVALALLVTVGLVCWLVVAPMLSVRAVLKKRPRRLMPWGEIEYRKPVQETFKWITESIDTLGGSQTAARKLMLYLRLPPSLAPDKSGAVILLVQCGRRPQFSSSTISTPGPTPVVRWGISPGEPTTVLGDVVRALIVCLDDDDPSMRQLCIEALGWLGPSARESLPKLTELLRDEHAPVRAATAGLLAKIGDPRVASSLVAALDDEDVQVRRNVEYALNSINFNWTTKSLESALKHKNKGVRAVAQATLRELRDPAHCEPYIAFLKAKSKEGPASLLVASLMPQALSHVLTALEHGDSEVRTWAATTLGKIGGPLAVPSLEAALKDKDEDFRQAAAKALEQIKAAQEKKQ